MWVKRVDGGADDPLQQARVGLVLQCECFLREVVIGGELDVGKRFVFEQCGGWRGGEEQVVIISDADCVSCFKYWFVYT